MKEGSLIISLDFELHWGGAEKWDLSHKTSYFDATRLAIPKMLEMFGAYEIRATWATVGFLFAKDRNQLKQFLPEMRPTYKNQSLSYYSLIDDGSVGADETADPYHFGHSLIQKILATPYQELGTHTFSHYYCNEPGQTAQQFDADLKAVQNLSKENFGVTLQSLVFPRNQFNKDYVDVAFRNGIKVIRTNPDVWFWKNNSKSMAIARAFDTLMPVSGSLSFRDMKQEPQGLLHLPASRFFRPYTDKEQAIRKLKNQRIKNEMTFAAKNRQFYHLWWHPHNFGNNTQENLSDLEDLLVHYKKLNEQYGFSSRSMLDMSI